MKNVIALILVPLGLQIATAQESSLYEQVTDNQPEIGVKTEVYLGDRMLTQREGEFRECIIPKRSFEREYMRMTWRIKAKQPLCKKDADSKFYDPNYFILPSCERPEVQRSIRVDCGVFVRILERDDGYELNMCRKQFGDGGNCYRKLRFEGLGKSDIEINDSYFLYTENTFQQSIEYAGRNDNKLKFLYSEFTDGFARQAFNREFQIDYSEGNVAAFKGALIEIHEATNTHIVYSVIRNFRD